MIEVTARVVRADEARIWVRTERQPGGCGRCDLPGGCRSVQITHLFRHPEATVELPNTVGALPGSLVTLSLPDAMPMRAALLSYALAAFLVVGGALLSAWLFGRSDAAVLGGAVAGGLGAWLLHRTLPRSRQWRSMLTVRLTHCDASVACQRAVEDAPRV